MRAQGATCLLVSGGFTRFAEPVAEELGFNRALANELLIEAGRLTGKVRRPIVGAAAKRESLIKAMGELGLDRAETMAVGDGVRIFSAAAAPAASSLPKPRSSGTSARSGSQQFKGSRTANLPANQSVVCRSTTV